MSIQSVALSHAAITVLASGIVVDKAKSDKLSATDLANLFHQVYGAGKPVVIVENANLFFTAKNLFTALESGDSSFQLILEHFKIELQPDELLTINRAVSIRHRIIDAVKSIKPAYTTEKVPVGWVLSEHLQIIGGSVRRDRRNPNGDGTGYEIGLKTLERLWKIASKVWAGDDGAISTVNDVRAGGYSRTAVVGTTSIALGCQTIRRYEIEQFAIMKGWDFPA